MPLPYQESLENTFDYEADWKELIESGASPSDSHLSHDAQESTLVGLVPWNKQRSAARYFLGFSYPDFTAPWRLYREQPQAHPVWPWLYAYDISFKPFIPLSNPDHDTLSPVIQGDFDDALKVAYHVYTIATVRYRNFMCHFLPDEDIATREDEWKRNVAWELEPKIEALSAEGVSQMKFKDTPTPGTNGPGVDAVFPAPIAVLQAKTGFVATWLNVPWEYVSLTDDYFYPEKILNCVGKVNATTFLGTFPAQTVFMQPPRFRTKTFPVPSDDPVRPLRSVDIQLIFDYFDPVRGAVTSGGGTPSQRGWQVLPWRGNRRYYAAVRDDNVSPLLEETDFTQAFTHIDDAT